MSKIDKNVLTCICIAHNYTEESFAGMSYYLAHSLASCGFRVLFMSHKPFFKLPKTINVGRGIINVYSWPDKDRPVGLKSFLWYYRLYKKYKPQKTIGHFVGGNITILVSKIFSCWRDETFIYYHTISKYNFQEWKGSNLKKKMIIYRKRLFYKLFCDQIICPTDLAWLDFQEIYAKRKKCQVVLNPIKDRFVSAHRLTKETGNIVISFLGRIEESKGILDLINGFKDYLANRPTSILRIQIAGFGSKVNLVKELAAYEPRLTVKDGMIYSEVDDYIRESDFMIIPSLSDNLPTVGLESLMNGIPLLLSSKTGLADYIIDEKEGYIFYPSREGIINVLNRVEANVSEIKALGQNARQTYSEKFTMDTYCNKMLKILK